MLVLPERERTKKGAIGVETKGVTCKIPLDLHNQISEEIRETESTMSKFIEMIIREHYEKGANRIMEKGRTLAFQVSEELFQRVKEYLENYEKAYHRRLTRQQAAEAVASLFGTNAVHSRSSRTYDPWEVTDNEGKTWRFVYDSSIHGSHRTGRQQVPIGDGDYKVEMNSPKLEYSEMGKLQEVVRTLRHAGAVVNGSCGMHVHVDASKHTPQSLKNALSIMYSKEDILFKALNVNESRVERWCQKVREPMLEKIRKLPSNTTMDRLRREWYEGSDGSYEHYNWTRYYALNLHSVFYRGTLEWRCFESTLHAGKVRANITLALAISAQAINQSRTVMRKTEISENPAFTFRTFLLRLGLIGPEYKNVREHLLSNLPGDRAWRYDKAQYPSLQNRQNHER